MGRLSVYRSLVLPDNMHELNLAEGIAMHSVKYVHWQEGEAWLGYLQDYPDYWTQGESLDDLLEHLRDLYFDLAGGKIPGARKVGEFVIP